jgi:hypothetical protein
MALTSLTWLLWWTSGVTSGGTIKHHSSRTSLSYFALAMQFASTDHGGRESAQSGIHRVFEQPFELRSNLCLAIPAIFGQDRSSEANLDR